MAQSLTLRKARAAEMFGGVPYVPPKTYYLALLKKYANPPEELTGTGYARVAVPNDSTHWTAPDELARVSNKKRIKWPKITVEDWPQISGFGIYDAPTGGECLYYAPTYITTPLIEDVQIVLLENGFTYQEY